MTAPNMPPLDAMPLFGPWPERWKDWPIEERLIAAYGLAASARDKVIERSRGTVCGMSEVDLCMQVAGLEVGRAVICKVLGKTEAEMDVLSRELWLTRGSTNLAGTN